MTGRFVPTWMLVVGIICDIGVSFLINRDAGIATASAAFLAWSWGNRG